MCEFLFNFQSDTVQSITVQCAKIFFSCYNPSFRSEPEQRSKYRNCLSDHSFEPGVKLENSSWHWRWPRCQVDLNNFLVEMWSNSASSEDFHTATRGGARVIPTESSQFYFLFLFLLLVVRVGVLEHFFVWEKNGGRTVVHSPPPPKKTGYDYWRMIRINEFIDESHPQIR